MKVHVITSILICWWPLKAVFGYVWPLAKLPVLESQIHIFSFIQQLFHKSKPPIFTFSNGMELLSTLLEQFCTFGEILVPVELITMPSNWPLPSACKKGQLQDLKMAMDKQKWWQLPPQTLVFAYWPTWPMRCVRLVPNLKIAANLAFVAKGDGYAFFITAANVTPNGVVLLAFVPVFCCKIIPTVTGNVLARW